MKELDEKYAPVSVVIPCYRCVDTISRAVHSIAQQTLVPSEIILVDDCSGDGTLELLYRLKNSYPDGWIKIVEQAFNDGPGTARNAGWDIASQPYLAFLDADDSWHPQKIEIQYNWMSKHPEVALTGHATQQIKSGESPPTFSPYPAGKVRFELISKAQLLLANRFSTPTVMLHKNLAPRFLPGKHYSEDYLLWCEICCSAQPCFRTKLSLAFLYKPHYGRGGLSGNLLKMEIGEMDTYIRIYRKQLVGIITLIFLLYWSAIRYFKRLLTTQVSRLFPIK